MRLAAEAMVAFAQRLRAARDDGADRRIGRRAPPAAGGELARPAQEDAVDGELRYGSTFTPRQNAMRSLMFAAAGFGSG